MWVSDLASYFALMSSVFVGFMLSWIKGGGLEYHRTYFLMLSLLLVPSQLDQGELEGDEEKEVVRGWSGVKPLGQRTRLP